MSCSLEADFAFLFRLYMRTERNAQALRCESISSCSFLACGHLSDLVLCRYKGCSVTHGKSIVSYRFYSYPCA